MFIAHLINIMIAIILYRALVIDYPHLAGAILGFNFYLSYAFGFSAGKKSETKKYDFQNSFNRDYG